MREETMPEPGIAQVKQNHDTVVAKLSFSSKGQLASFVSQYGLWAAAAVSTGVLSELFFPYDGPTDVPLPVVFAALLGLGIWVADINNRNRRGRGWVPDTFFGVFISAVIFVWSYILTILASGNFEQFMSALLVVSF
jgi:hypothetical protein